jgi:hypothetical protein
MCLRNNSNFFCHRFNGFPQIFKVNRGLEIDEFILNNNKKKPQLTRNRQTATTKLLASQ